MIVVLKKDVKDKEKQAVIAYIEAKGLRAHVSVGTERTVIGAIGDERVLEKESLEILPGVEKVMPILKPYKLVSKEFKPEYTKIKIKDVEIGGKKIVVMAGPCALESEEQLYETAKAVKKAGAEVLRASVYKPRTSPYSFQGYGDKGLKILRNVADELGLLVETEVMDIRKLEMVAKYVDIVRVGARNMQNFDLLKEVGRIKNPVTLKRGIAATLEEFLMAAEYIMSEGNHNVIFCERGIRTYETATRNTLDISAVPIIKNTSHLPVIVDPSHAGGKRELVAPLSKASIAAGADGLIIEVHSHPEKALSDGKQSLLPEQFGQLMKELKPVAEAVGRKL
jgi:3-deoxy-7-phosphoheptulonate synthase